MSEPTPLLQMAKDLVLAQIKAKSLSPDEMHTALQKTYITLSELHAQETTPGPGVVTRPQRRAARDWKKSITRNSVTCLVCNDVFKQLSIRHLKAHGLDVSSYRQRYGIPPHQPLSARYITKIRQQVMRKTKAWEKSGKFPRKQEEPEPARVVTPPKRVSRKKTS
jgi:predicted transcriptional regulator